MEQCPKCGCYMNFNMTYSCGNPKNRLKADMVAMLDTIRDEIEKLADADGYGDYQLGFSFGLMMAMEIIDKYRAERSDKE